MKHVGETYSEDIIVEAQAEIEHDCKERLS
jgi:hypothetical protein